MSKHIIFFVHGMGKHDTTWHNPGVEVLKNAFGDYAAFSDGDFEGRIEAIPIVFDDAIEVWRQRMAADFAAFKAALLGGMDPTDSAATTSVSNKVDKIESWIGAGEPNFVWSHAMDVVLYRFAALLWMAIDVSVARQILARLKQGNFRSWSVIGHSLGTSVVHNALNSLYSTNLGGIPKLSPAETRPRTLMMVANVSRVLQRPGAKVLESLVKPGPLSADRLCGFYLNVRHRLDPFVYPKPFQPDLWPDASTFATSAYQHIQPSHIHFDPDEVFKVHDFDHYLKNPRVHVPLFRSIFGVSTIPDSEFETVRQKFDAVVISKNLELARSRLEAKLSAPSGGWQQVIEIVKRIRS